MTSSDDYVSSSSDYTSYNDPPSADQQSYSLNSKIMVAAIIVLFFVVFFISSLHMYSKWLWRSNRHGSSLPAHAEPATSHPTIPPGLDKAAIALLPTFFYKPAEVEKGADSPECAVCLSEFQEDEKGRMLPSCKHSFHVECIDMWFYSHSTCPLCRTEVKPAELASSSFPPLTHEQGQPGQAEALHRQAQNEISATPASHTITIGSAAPYSTDVFIDGGLQAQIEGTPSPAVNSKKPSPSSTRYAPHITIEIPTRQHYNMILSPTGCLSLSSRRSRGTSPAEQACSTSLKSPGLRVSLTRMLSSKGKGVASNHEDSVESPNNTITRIF